MPDVRDHPLATYTREYNEARDQLVTERIRQQRFGDDDGLSEHRRAQARANALELSSEIGHLDAENTAFLVGVFTGAFPPSEDVVRETVELNKALANVVVNANRPAAMLRILKSFLDGAIAVATGKVPPSTLTPTAQPPAPAAGGG